jgi:Tol biopolymer transport system component
VSDNGTLIYRPGVAGHSRLVWVNRAGEPQDNAAPAGTYHEVSLSPDEKRVAFARPGDAGTDVWLTDLERRITSRFTFRPPVNNVPIWSPDGRQIVFASARDGRLDLYTRASDASGPETLLLRLQSQPILFPSDWSSDGRLLAYYRSDPKSQLDIWTLSLETGRRFGEAGRADSRDTPKPIPFLNAEFNESQGQFSPDSRWMAYVSDESGTQQVYVQSFPRLGGQRQISTEGGTQPRWRRDGKELFYLAPDRKLMAVSVKMGVAFEADTPRALFQTELNTGDLRQSYAVSADGQRFLLNTPLEGGPPPITVVLNWPALLKN